MVRVRGNDRLLSERLQFTAAESLLLFELALHLFSSVDLVLNLRNLELQVFSAFIVRFFNEAHNALKCVPNLLGVRKHQLKCFLAGSNFLVKKFKLPLTSLPYLTLERSVVVH